MSEILENFNRIAVEKGLLKEAEPMTAEEKESDKEYRENIQALYGIEIPLNDSKKDIIEQAHPEKVIIAPSYDRLNGLVENIRERQDIMVGIVNKPTNGNLTQHRYAAELSNELTRLGFKYDIANKGHIAKLADKCSAKLNNELKKEAFAWLAALAWGARILGAASVFSTVKTQLIGNISEGVQPDVVNAAEALNQLYTSVSAVDKPLVEQWIRNLEYVAKVSTKADALLSKQNFNAEAMTIDSKEQMMEESRKVQGTPEEIAFAKKYIRFCEKVIDGINKFTDRISNMQIESGKASSEWSKGLSLMWESITGDSKDDAINAMDALRTSLLHTVESFKEQYSDAGRNAPGVVKGLLSSLQEMME